MQPAVIYDSPITGQKKIYTYAQMLDEVAAFGGVLQEMGVGKGDRVIVYMPMIPEALIAMLACARIGAIHSVVFGGFAANELAVRIEDTHPKLIVSASCGIEPNRVVHYKPLLDHAIELSSAKPEACIVVQRPQQEATLIPGRDYDYASLMASAKSRSVHSRCEPMASTDPLYILYTSGTTGKPKGVVRDTGGHMVALKWTMHKHYGIAPGDVFWAASDVGWVVGHSYIAYAPLLHGATTILYEGKPVGTPDAGAFWRVISEYKVKALFTAPTAFRAIKKEDPNGTLLANYDLSHFKTLFLAGERADPNTVQWAEDLLKVPVIDHWWQTETAWAIAGNCAGLGLAPVKHGSPTFPLPGYDLRVLNESNEEVKPGQTGALSIRLPMPPGCLPTLWQNDRGFIESYLTEFPGYYKTADAGYIDEDGYVFVMSRTDDIINVAGHRLSTGGIEEVVASHPDVAECAVIGVADGLKGHVPAGFVLSEGGCRARDQRHREGDRRTGARPDRPRCRLQDGADGQPPAQDALGQDPPGHHAEDRRRRGIQDARDHRRSRGFGGDNRGAKGERLPVAIGLSGSSVIRETRHTPHPNPLPMGEGTRSQRLRGRPLSHGERDRVRGVTLLLWLTLHR